ncbi:MAG TPA: hypothetical protein VF989_19285 [Polyangiaceae bacterium]
MIRLGRRQIAHGRGQGDCDPDPSTAPGFQPDPNDGGGEGDQGFGLPAEYDVCLPIYELPPP